MIANNLTISTGNLAAPDAAMNGAAPETAGFDFMNYLLGLQTSPLAQESTENLAGNGPADAKSLEALLKGALAKTDHAEDGKTQKNELAQWNLLFPGMVPNASPGVPTIQPNTLAQVDGRTLPQGAKSPVDQVLAQVGLARIQPAQAGATPATTAKLSTAVLPQQTNELASNWVHVDSQHPELHGARILQVETFDSRAPQAPAVATATPFVGTSAQLQTQGALAQAGNPIAKPQAVAQRYTQVSRGEMDATAVAPRHAAGTEFGAEMAVSDKGERKENLVDAKSSANVDPTLAANAQPGAHAIAGKANTEVTPNTGPVPHTIPHVMQRAASMAQAGGGRMTVALSPPELGKVEVQITTRGKRVEIKMTSDSSMAKSVLESGLGDLRKQLEGQNLTLGHTEVQVSREHFGSSLQQQTAQQQFSGQHGGFQSSRDERGSQQGSGGFSRGESRGVERVPTVAARRVASAPGRVDVRI